MSGKNAVMMVKSCCAVWGVPIAQAEVVELVFTDFLQIKKEDLSG